MEQNQNQQAQRQTAYKVPINALIKNQFIEQQGWNPNYIGINDKKVSRVNLIATVIDKQISDTLATLTLDDSTAIIQAKAFNEDTRKTVDINIGDPVLLIGRPRKYNDQLFLTIEIIKKVNPLWAKIRKLELKKEFDLNKIETNQTEHLEENQAQRINLNQSGERILGLIKSLDEDNGADLNEVIKKSGMHEQEAENILKELIKLGEVYEPQPNKIKLL